MLCPCDTWGVEEGQSRDELKVQTEVVFVVVNRCRWCMCKINR